MLIVADDQHAAIPVTTQKRGRNVARLGSLQHSFEGFPLARAIDHQQNPRGAKDITPHASAPVSPRETQSHGIPGEKSKPKKAPPHTSCSRLLHTPA